MSASTAIDQNHLRAIAKWLISWDLDLRPFYEQVASHRIMGPVTAALPGLKPLRPATLFEMAAIAITEQQLSLAAAFHIRTRSGKTFRNAARWTLDIPIAADDRSGQAP